LDLSGTPSWEQLPVTGAPPPSLGRSATYDPVRDRVILVGFGQGDSFVDGTGGRVDAVTLAGGPSWVSLSENIAQAGPNAPAPHGYDPFHDRLLSSPALWEFPFGSAPEATLSCPGDLVWTPGSTLTVTYGVTNPDAADQFADYTLTSERSWPGLPISGSVQVPGRGGADIVAQVAVPDTAAHGLNTLHLHATLRDAGTPLDCSHHLHDLATAALGSLSLVELLADGVSLTWQAPGAAGEPALVERGDDSGWSVIGAAD